MLERIRLHTKYSMMKHIRIIFIVSFYFIIQLSHALPECTSDRPGWADHRTIYVPESMMSYESIDDAWTEALCCVYTYVQVTFDQKNSNKARFELYDGWSYKIQATSFEELASKAYDDICDMQMGSQDCRKNASCVQAAFATLSPTSTPTFTSTSTPTSSPTVLPTATFSPSTTSIPSYVASEHPSSSKHPTIIESGTPSN